MSNVRTLPGVFPLHEDRDFLSEREWVCLQLICQSRKTLADADAVALSEATAGQISVERARDIIETARIARLDGLGTWIARLMVQAGLTFEDAQRLPAEEMLARVNAHAGYALCNAATVRALRSLQALWAGKAPASGT